MAETMPPPLSAKYTDSFAFPSMKDRVPVIIAKIVDSLSRNREEILQAYVEDKERAQEELKSVIGTLSQLRYEVMTNKPAAPIRDSGPDAGQWNKELDIEKEKNGGADVTWFDSAWLWVECYLYRRVQEAVELCNLLKPLDVFENQKQDAFTNSFTPISILTMYLTGVVEKLQHGLSDFEISNHFMEFLQMSLWGNKCDLSISGGTDNFQVNSPLEQLATHKPKILVDNTMEVLELLRHVKQSNGGTPGKVAIVLDNAGFELLTDLCFAEFLLVSGLASSIHFHAKSMPWYVSDVTEKDFHWMLNCMASMDHIGINQFSQTWKSRLQDKSWQLESNSFWTMPNDYSQMEDRQPQLYAKMQHYDLIFFKGDLNYRKLVGDLQWNTTTDFSHSLRGFHPAPVCSLRTLKCDVVVGLAPGQAEETANENANWMIIGEWAVISLAG